MSLNQAAPNSFWVIAYTRNSGWKDTYQQNYFQTD